MNMRFSLHHNGKKYIGELNEGIDISIPYTTDPESARAWYVEGVKIEAVRLGEWEGKVKDGKGVNFNWVRFAPHAHGTHTECLGHISENAESVNQSMSRSHFLCKLISIDATEIGEDRIIRLEDVKNALSKEGVPEALIIRSHPNSQDKLKIDYSGINPPYLEKEIADYLVELGVEHLILDLPSPDREEDGGLLSFHHAFWTYPEDPRHQASITELAYIPNEVKDGLYMVEIQLAPIENNAAPSRPVLYPLEEA